MPDPHERFMRLALGEAHRGIRKGAGGPFGACIVKGGRVVAVGHNRVLAAHNPTLHAEIVALGRASRKLGTHLLDGCVVYSTTEPCPMCFAALHWARVAAVHFGTTVPDVKRLGFNELTLSNATLKRLGRSPVKLFPGLLREECRQLLRDWTSLPTRRTY